MKFNNLKVGYRLGLGFFVALLLLAGAIFSGSKGVVEQAHLSEKAFLEEVTFLSLSEEAHIDALGLRRYEKDVFLNIEKPEKTAGYFKKWTATMDKLEQRLGELAKVAHGEGVPEQVASMQSAAGEYRKGFELVYGAVQQGAIKTPQDGNKAIKEYKTPIRTLFATAKGLSEQARKNVEVIEEEILATRASTLQTLSVSGVLSLVLLVFLGWVLTKSVLKPVQATLGMIENLEGGRFEQRLKLNRKDEFGDLANAMDRFADSLSNEVVANLDKLAAGDLNFQVVPRDGQDSLRVALQALQRDLVQMIQNIQASAEEVNGSSMQVAQSSQGLSQGTTQQASAIEEISASMQELSVQTGQNAENAMTANQLATEVSAAADRGNNQMAEMVEAMKEINEAGQSIGHIIKTIDEIAFQTNLLALNAAVEAARAGQHGKGFAVVAEEVRNLAGRSARAASETAALIEGSVQKGENGAAIAERTADALKDIVDGIGKTSDLIQEIATSSNEQAQGIKQINGGISQVETVTQTNTSSAEESAASAEELSHQAQELRKILARFKLENTGAYIPTSTPATGTEAAPPLSLVRPAYSS